MSQSSEWETGFLDREWTPHPEGRAILETRDDGLTYLGIKLDHWPVVATLYVLRNSCRVSFRLDGDVCWLTEAVNLADNWTAAYSRETWEQRARRTWNG